MSNKDKKRLFIALNLPEEIKDELSKIINILRHKLPGVKWVESEGLHITLHFLGNINATAETKTKEAMERLAGKFGVFEFELGGLGAFPNLDRPRVIFVECRQLVRNSAMALQKSLGQEILIRAEIKLNRRPWTPHITLGRVKSRKSPGSIHCPIPNTEFRVPTFDLMESVLRPSGAEYKIIEKFNTNQ